MQDFKKFEVSYNGKSYTAQLDFSAIRRADELRIMELKDSPISFTAAVFYCSVLKHHPNASQRKVREFFDEVIQDEEYGISSFDEIVEEFIQHFLAFAAPGRKTGKKRFSPVESASVPNAPRPEK